MIELILFPFFIFLFAVLQGFFAMSEMAMVSSNRYKLQHLANNNNRSASIILNLLNNPDKLFGTTLVGINLATVVSTSLADHFLNYILPNYLPINSLPVSIEVLTLISVEPLLLIVGELVPMSIGRRYPNTTSLRNATLINAGYLVFYPFMIVISSISRFIGHLLGADSGDSSKLTRDELKQIVCSRFTDGKNETGEIINDIFDINELSAGDIMVNLSDVTAIKEGSSIAELREIIRKTNYSRIPVYRESIFNIISTIHINNIIGRSETDIIDQFTDKLYIVPSTKPIIQILSEFKRNRKYMAVVVDEFGAVCGIITLEDILEEIVGDIEDEFDEPEFKTFALKEQNIYEARCDLEDLLDESSINIITEGAQTISGLINLKLGRIGRAGEELTEQGYRITILEATDKVVKKVRITKE